MNYDILYVNGDSYTQPDEKLTYPDYIAKKSMLDLKNSAVQGSNNNRIIRSSIIEIDKLIKQNKKLLIIIGLSFIRRQETWEDVNFLQSYDNIPDKRDFPFKNIGSTYGPISVDYALEFASKDRLNYLKTKILHENYNMPHIILNFYMTLYLFVNWLEKNNLNYYIFSAADNKNESTDYYDCLDDIEFVKEIKNNKNIENIHDFNFLDWSKNYDSEAEKTGHLSPEGHKKMADFLHKKLIDKKLVY